MDRMRVLILEDRPTDAELMAAELRRAGLSFNWHRVDREREYLASLSPPPDLILSDFNMPQFSVPRALRILKERGLDIPLIVVSGSIGEDAAVQVLHEGAADYLLKDRLTRLGAAATQALEAKHLRDTARKAEQALADNEKRFRALFEHSADAVILIDANGRVVYGSPSTARVLGHGWETPVGRNAFADIHPDDLPRARTLFEQLLQEPSVSVTSEVRVRHEDETWRWVEGTSANLLQDASVQAIVWNFRDVTERKTAELRLAETASRLAEAQEIAQLGSWELDIPSGRMVWSNAMFRVMSMPDSTTTRLDTFLSPAHPEDRGRVAQTFEQAMRDRRGFEIENRIVRPDGEVRVVHSRARLLADETDHPLRLVGTTQDVTEQRRTEEMLALERTLLRTLIDTVPVYINIKDLEGRYRLVNSAYAQFLEANTPDEIVGKTVFDVFPKEEAARAYEDDQMVMHTERIVRVEALTRSKTGKNVQWQAVSKVPLRDGSGHVVGIVGSAHDITDRKTAEKQIEQQLATLTALYASAQRLSQSLDLVQLTGYVVETSVKTFGARLAWVGRAEPDGSIPVLAQWPPDHPYPQHLNFRWDDSPTGRGPSGQSLRSGLPTVVSDVASNPSLMRREALLAAGLTALGAFPLISRNKPFGVLVLYSDRPDFFTPTRVEFFQAFAHLAAASLENARLLNEQRQRVQQLQALREIDTAITGSFDLKVTLAVLLDKVTASLNVDAADILLFNPHSNTLEFKAGRGFRTPALEHTRLPIGRGPAGRAALEGVPVSIPDLTDSPDEFVQSPHLRAEGFVGYYAVPLESKGQLKGVLEVFDRKRLEPESEWIKFAEALAGQAAIALDNAALLADLTRANRDLTLAYDSTLEGWSRALDLRDHETEGHSQRVTDLTLRLARALGMRDDQLLHIRRGALLHDIGKIRIPDNILHKPGPLTEEEWVEMRKHPTDAYKLLSPIPFLRPALDIPRYHHEKWDGTGYPDGLKGDQIPLAARIFAVGDVYDALTSDRPYRKAWPKDKALSYIREQSGKHFDPAVVAKLLEVEA